MTDHFLLMTATPHKGDPEHFRRFLALLDPDVYGSIESLQRAVREHEAPFYLRRTKEALVTFPDPETGEVRKLFTKRDVRPAAFDFDGEELEFYDELTRYVEDQSMAAAGQETARARAVGFTMAMLQRRMASSVYAVRRSLERMRARRQKILDDPEAYRQEQIERKLPDDFEELTEEEQTSLIEKLADEVLSVDPATLREEIGRLSVLIDRQQNQLGEYLSRQIEGQTVQGLDGLISQAEEHLDKLINRLDSLQAELSLERHCAISDINHLGRAWVVPHPERATPQLAPMVRDDEIERIAVQVAIRHEEARGWVVESVESENRGFDLISRRPHSEHPKTFVEVRFIEVKGRAGVGVVALSSNEYTTANRIKGDYWLYVVFNCGSTPQLNVIRNPATLGWKPVMAVEHYQIGPESIRQQV